MLPEFEKVAVLGAGTMGNGIAHVFAQHGYAVNLVDLNPDVLGRARDTIAKNLNRQVKKGLLDETQQHATLDRITPQTDFSEGVADRSLVVEAVSENLDLKLKIFRELNEATAPETILASNTSSISITQLAAATKRPGKVIGMHFMNPVPVMKLVEVIRGHDTSDATLASVVQVSEDLGKTPVPANDYPGFVANRILMPMINEAIFALWEGVAEAEHIDQIMHLGMAHPMGPLTLADFIGLDVCLAILEVLYDGYKDPKYRPCPLLVNLVRAGHHGRKTGRGFYTY